MKNLTYLTTLLIAIPSVLAACQTHNTEASETAASASYGSEQQTDDSETPTLVEAPHQPEPLEVDKYDPDTYRKYEGSVEPATSLVATESDCGDVAVYFRTDSAELKEEGKNSLDEVAECLKGKKTKDELAVTGHADPRGTEQYNEELSRQRAKAVVDYLEDKGVSATSFELYARGEEGKKEGMPKLWPEQRRAEVEAQ